MMKKLAFFLICSFVFTSVYANTNAMPETAKAGLDKAEKVMDNNNMGQAKTKHHKGKKAHKKHGKKHAAK